MTGGMAIHATNPTRRSALLKRRLSWHSKCIPATSAQSGGIVTDEFGRALRPDGTVIAGLYATGNSTASVMGRTYPGAGASIGAAFVFGYIAARHAAGATLN
ncbi:MAG: FAD-binding protein [Rhodospirillales bacterium]